MDDTSLAGLMCMLPRVAGECYIQEWLCWPTRRLHEQAQRAIKACMSPTGPAGHQHGYEALAKLDAKIVPADRREGTSC